MRMKVPVVVLAVALLSISACETKTSTVDSCGDGFVDPGEDCDGNVGEEDCASLGHYLLTGTLRCKANCTYDLSECGGKCGDNTVDSTHGEECDGLNLNGNSCQNLGFGGGTLTCHATCRSFDESGCGPVGRCGDGVVQGAYGELCDTSDLAGETCITKGFYGGILTCAPNCQGFNTGACFGRCGDGVIQAA